MRLLATVLSAAAAIVVLSGCVYDRYDRDGYNRYGYRNGYGYNNYDRDRDRDRDRYYNRDRDYDRDRDRD